MTIRNENWLNEWIQKNGCNFDLEFHMKIKQLEIIDSNFKKNVVKVFCSAVNRLLGINFMSNCFQKRVKNSSDNQRIYYISYSIDSDPLPSMIELAYAQWSKRETGYTSNLQMECWRTT